ncbi:hypothetical protein [Streptobacillus moniliformis]|nr:hypothetical protein [Streptobacillus moniliformis]
MYKISNLPFSKSKGEHPYWVILKLNFIKEIFNEVNIEETKGK